MSSKKGAFVYQQIELTTAEWATEATIYPASVWLFERLETGKFNMKLADGVHVFAELATVMEGVKVEVKSNTEEEYVLTIISASGEIDTPNLKGATYTHPKFTTHESGFYKVTVDDEGHITSAIPLAKKDITDLGIPSQDTVYNDAALRQSVTDNLQLAKTYTNEQIATIVGFSILPVPALPATGQSGVIYLVPKSGSGADVHNEYIWLTTESKFELIGNTAIDLSGYYTKTDSDAKYATKQDIGNINTVLDTINGKSVIGATAEKLQAIINSKAAIKSTIETKGQVVGNAPLDEYAGEIAAIQTGFDGEVLTINVNTNQSDTPVPTSGIQVIIKHGAETVTRNWIGAELSEKVPPGAQVEVSVTGTIANFRSPAKQSFVSFHDNARPLVFAYEAEKATVNVTAEGGTNITGQTLKITNTTSGAILYQGAAGTSKSVKVPFGSKYTVSVNDLSGYTTPDAQEFTASGVSRTVSVFYERIKATLLTFDKSISDSENITGDEFAFVGTGLLAGFRRCLSKKSADGEMTICYPKNDNSNFYNDGTAAKLDGTEGDVMVYKPEFYYKHETVGGTKFAYRIALFNLDGTYIHSPASLIGAYKAYTTNGKLYSRSGVTPTVSQTIRVFESQAAARGTGYQLIDYEQHCMIALMFYLKYHNRNSQAVLGAGGASYDPAPITGTTNGIGNVDTVESRFWYVNFLGIEGVFGSINEWVSGVDITNYVWTIKNPGGTTRNVTAAASSGWIKEIAASVGPYFDVMPTEGGGSETTYYSDYYYAGSGSRVLARSFSSASASGGVACSDASSDASYAGSHVGSRLAFRGVIREASSVAAFKTIPITN